MSESLTDTPPKLDFPAPLGNAGKQDNPPPPAGASDSAPKRRGRPPGSTNRNSMSVKSIEDALAQQFTLIGTVTMAFNEYDGTVILQGTPQLAKALANLCDKNPKIKKNVERMLAGGTYGEVIIAAGLIAMPIMANHGLMPPSIRSLYGAAIPEKEDEEAVAT
jgi:hypothetical protein